MDINLSNYRYNQLGGVDADRTLDSGEIVPYTLSAEEVASLTESIGPAVAMPEPSYREKRALRYSQELSPEGSQSTAIGDCIDALIAAVADNDLTKLDEIKAKIDLIKQDIPKV